MSNTSNAPSQDKNREDLMSYRIDKLEKGFDQLLITLTQLKDIVVRWDSRFSHDNFSPAHLQIQSERIDTTTKRVDELEKDVDSLKSYCNKAIGALVIVSLIVQLVGPILIEKVRPSASDAPQIMKIEER